MAVELIAPIVVSGIFTGRVGFLPGESRGSAIAKEPLTGRCIIGHEGILGDEHADARVHGGGEKAVHLFPQENHEALAKAFPEARYLIPGGLGENLSTRGITEETAFIGDIFALGTARLQIAQPRTPCWKIDVRCGAEGVAVHVAEHGIAGWYFRVLKDGECAAGDALIHLERLPGAISLADFNLGQRSLRPSMQALERLVNAPGLAPDWIHKIRSRIEWLQKNGAGS